MQWFFEFFRRAFPIFFKSQLKRQMLVAPVKNKTLVINGDRFHFEDEEQAKISAFRQSMELGLTRLLRQPNANYAFADSIFTTPYRTNGASRKRKSNRLHLSRKTKNKHR